MQILLIRDVDTISMGRSILSFRGNILTFVNYHRDECISPFFYFSKPSVQTLIKSHINTLCGISSGYSLFVKVSVFHCLLQYQVATDKRLPPAIIGQSIVCNVKILSLKYGVCLLTVCSIMRQDLYFHQTL